MLNHSLAFLLAVLLGLSAAAQTTAVLHSVWIAGKFGLVDASGKVVSQPK
jgi:hypothetical protein